ncbi:hypothetical protein [Larsenimonas rhizosphaerae]|uniref:hypothetical protein n=1 Tax=Larsenimonas rhizosphaerae TaxID=2944682 RepID=UPI00203418E8|nr:hypothetical protein [Larsenimonas rhizosphaerae]MCM2130255.1 hypothetical protein [Larsenimonas rhizosphaerae]
MTTIIFLNNIEELRQRTPAKQEEVVEVDHHTVPGYGSGRYRHAPSSKNDDDGGDTIVTSSGARYQRIWSSGETGNPLMWGADPTGKTSSSDAFQRLADSQLVTTIEVPTRGIFSFDRTVELTNRLKVVGKQWGHFGNSSNRASLKSMNELEGPIFSNVYHAQGLSFFAPNNARDNPNAYAIKLNGYCNQVSECTFRMKRLDAIHTDTACDITIRDCQFTDTHACLEIGNKLIATTVRFIRNQCQYVTYGILSGNEFWGGALIDNVWEVCDNSLIRTKTIFNTRIEGNWIERGGNSDKPIPIIKATARGQITDCFASGNSFHFASGWKNTLSPEAGRYTNAFGGVNVDNNTVSVSSATGAGSFFKVNGITQELDDWTRLNDFSIETNRNRNGAADIKLNSAGNITLKAGKKKIYISEGEDEHSEVELYYPRRILADAGTDANIALAPFMSGHFQARVPVINTLPADSSKKVIASALTAMPYLMEYDGPYKPGEHTGKGMALFDTVEIDDEYVSLINDHYHFRDPIVMVTVNQEGLRFSHWEPINAYGHSWSAYQRCKGVRLYFKDAKTGNAVIPESRGFALMFMETDGK